MKVIVDIPEIPKNDKQRWALANGTPYGQQEAWIPCKERLPDKRGFYLITFKTGGDGRSVVMKFYRTESNLWTDDGMNRGFYLLPDEVTAWMPLPEPKEAEEGE